MSKETALDFGLSEPNEILIRVDGEIEDQVLQDMLEEIADYEFCEGAKVDQSIKIPVLQSKRVKNFDPDNPEWDTIEKTQTIRTLRKWYKNEHGRPYERIGTKAWNSMTGQRNYH